MFVRASVNDDTASIDIVGPSNAVFLDIAGDDATGSRGDAARPFLTLQAAMAVMQSGDEILASPGTFSSLATTSTLPALANVIIRGSGEFAGGTIFTANAGVDVITLNAANRAVMFNNLQIAGLTTGRAVVGTGAAAARAWMNSGLVFEDCILTSAAGLALDLTYAGVVEMLNCQVTAGGLSFSVCSTVLLDNVLASTSTLLTSWDEADVLRPTAGQGETTLNGGTTVGATTVAGLQTVGPVLTGGSPKLNARADSVISSLTGLNLGDNAAAHLSIKVAGTVGAIDFQSTAAKQLPDTATALTIDFQRAILTGASILAKVGGAAANAQTIHAEGLVAKSAATFTADVKVSMNLTGAALAVPTYTTPGATGDITPPRLAFSALDIHLASQAFLWAVQYTGLVRVTTAPTAIVCTQSNVAGGATAVGPKSTTGFTVATETATGGNTGDVICLWT